MRVLAIGNSYSQDATRYLHDIAKADGCNLQAANLYIGNCTLELHHKNMQSGARDYELQFDGHMTGFFLSMDEALTSRKWDVVTLQQRSALSGYYDTYFPYLQELADHVRTLQPEAKIVLHQTWAYEEGSARLSEIAKFTTATEMLEHICTAYARAAEAICADGIIPSGELFGKLLAGGVPSVHRDSTHATLGLGRYALGLLWYRMLTGAKTANNPFRDFAEPVSEAEQQLAKTLVDSFKPL